MPINDSTTCGIFQAPNSKLQTQLLDLAYVHIFFATATDNSLIRLPLKCRISCSFVRLQTGHILSRVRNAVKSGVNQIYAAVSGVASLAVFR